MWRYDCLRLPQETQSWKLSRRKQMSLGLGFYVLEEMSYSFSETNLQVWMNEFALYEAFAAGSLGVPLCLVRRSWENSLELELLETHQGKHITQTGGTKLKRIHSYNYFLI